MVFDEVEKKKIALKMKEQAKANDSSWYSYFFGSSKTEEEKKEGINKEEWDRLYSALGDTETDANEVKEDSMIRVDEYYWLVGEFTLCKGLLKIQRDVSSGSGGFKEEIILRYEGIKSKFMKRYKGLDIESGIENVELVTSSTLDKKNKVESVIISRNPLTSYKSNECLGFIKMCFLPPNTDMQFEMNATAKSLKIYYLPFLIGRFMMFLGQDEVRSNTYNSFSEIRDNTQDTINAALEGKKSKILITIESPVVLIPISKNNDPTSPTWCLKLGDLSISSKVLVLLECSLTESQSRTPEQRMTS